MIAVYARVSTEDQARKGYSLMDQIRACRALYPAEDILEFVDEGVSGEVLDRPALSRLRKAVRDGGITRVVCLDPDRLSRKLVNQLIISEELEKRAALIFVNGEYAHSAEGRLFYQLRGAISEFEKAKINERMSRGRREKALQGKVVRDYQIYGYDYDKVNGKLIINPFEAKVVKDIFGLFTGICGRQMGISGIAAFLNKSGIPTKRGANMWHRQVVRQLLSNRAYVGEFFQNRWNCEGMLGNRYKAAGNRAALKQRPRNEWILVGCPPIISPEEFESSRQLLEQARRRWAGAGKHAYLLGGLVKCGRCGFAMTGRLSRNWGKPVYVYTDKKRFQGKVSQSCGRVIDSEYLDQEVWKAVTAYLMEYVKKMDAFPYREFARRGCYSFIGDRSGNEDNQENDFAKRLLEIKEQRRNLITAVSGLSEELGKSGLADLKKALYELKNEEHRILKSLEEQLLSNEDAEECTFILVYYIINNLDLLTFEDKKQLVRLLVREITVTGESITILGF